MTSQNNNGSSHERPRATKKTGTTKNLMRVAFPGIFGSGLIAILDRLFDVTRFENPGYLYAAFVLWFIGSHAIYWGIERNQLRRTTETLLVASALLLAAYYLTREKHRFLDWASEAEDQRASSAQAHLYRAIHQATLPYYDKDVKARFIDNNHDYKRLKIDLYDIRNTGVLEYELKGQTLHYEDGKQIRFPFGSNVELPYDIKKYMQVIDLRDDGEKHLSFEATPVRTKHRTYLYEAAIPEFKGDVHYVRILCHPTAQFFNPEAFLLFLDLFKGRIEELEINLFSDKELGKVLLQAPVEFNPRTATYTWADREPPEEEGPIESEEYLQATAAKAAERRSDTLAGDSAVSLVSGYTIRIKNPTNIRLFVIYFKGEMTKERFL